MKHVRTLLLLPLLAAYCAIFIVQERLYKETVTILQPVPSFQLLRASSGYLHQLVAEIIFIQSGVFLGDLKPGIDHKSYAPALAHNYQQITSLYPEFIDPYYYTQSYLPYIAPEFASHANDILATARKAYPENLNFPFFQAVNLFRFMDEPLKAAEVFREASLLPEAPPMFAHLAVILSAEGGLLEAGIISLQAMIKSTDDEVVKVRYQEEMELFKAAIKVQQAVNAYHGFHQQYPETLEELVPLYLDALPSFGRSFELTWKPPVVGLKRPTPK